MFSYDMPSSSFRCAYKLHEQERRKGKLPMQIFLPEEILKEILH